LYHLKNKEKKVMTFDDSSALLDRIQVDYRNESYDDNYDDAYGENYDDNYDDGAEFLPFLPNPVNLIGRGLSSVGRILGGDRPPQRVQLTGVRPNLPNISGIPGLSNLFGNLSNQNGKNLQFKLPPNVATKEDIATLKRAIDAHNTEIKKVGDAVTRNAQETAKIAGEVNRVDVKHIKATQEQNKVMSTIGTQISRMGKRVNQLNKELKDSRQQSMMLMLLPMMMDKEPELETISLKSDLDPKTETSYSVTRSAYKDEDDNNMMLLLVMMMSGGFGGSSGGSNDMMLPMMLMMMK
jgi:hypothetical protein